MLSVMLIVLLGSQWFVPPHILWKTTGMAQPLPERLGHSAHGHSSSSSTVTPLHHPCCEQDDGAPSFHGDLCCGLARPCPAPDLTLAPTHSICL
jgi:hypothetical protein